MVLIVHLSGFSAGYYNTVGSKDGWAPSTFTSSRGERNIQRTQQVEDFLDEDEIEERKRRKLESTSQYDTFATEAAQAAHQQPAFETRKDRGLIPGVPVILDDLVAPVANSIGVKMLISLGWRRGRGIGTKEISYDTGLQNKSLNSIVGIENTPMYILKPKSDIFGLGYNPYENASEFLQKASDKRGGELKNKKNNASGIGFGVFDEDDMIGLEDEYGTGKTEYVFELNSDDEKTEHKGGKSRENRGRSSDLPKTHLLKGAESKDDECIDGFSYGGTLENRAEYKWFPAPRLPANFIPLHKSADTITQEDHRESIPRADPPQEPQLLRVIDTLAFYVAKNGTELEKLAKERNEFDSKFNFLHGGKGSGYYKWKVSEERKKLRKLALKTPDAKPKTLCANDRAALLKDENEDFRVSQKHYTERKEKPSMPKIATEDKLRLQSAFRSTFTGGKVEDLGSVQHVGLYYPNKDKGPTKKVEEDTTAGEHTSSQDTTVQRFQELWQPEYLLCKRFGVKDPHDGKAITSITSNFRYDNVFLPETSKTLFEATPKYLDEGQASHADRANTGVEEKPTLVNDKGGQNPDNKVLAEKFLDNLMIDGIDVQKNISVEGDTNDDNGSKEYVEKPLDLFKAIFEDSEDDVEDVEEVDQGNEQDMKPKEEENDAEQKMEPPKEVNDVLSRYSKSHHRKRSRRRHKHRHRRH